MNITYRQFIETVKIAQGSFSYSFWGQKFTCDPLIYIAMHWPNGLPA